VARTDQREAAATEAPDSVLSGAAKRALPLLDIDSELADAVPVEDRELARAGFRAPAYTIDPGDWAPPDALGRLELLGLMVTRGALIRDVTVGRNGVSELLGPGDVVRPWDHAEEVLQSPVPSECGWRALEATTLAVLDSRFGRLAGRWPSLMNVLMQRTTRRARMLTVQVAIGRLGGVALRLELLLWHLADRWGTVTREGVQLPLPLTHETLGRLVGAQRPSVTTALSELARRRVVKREPGGWLLCGSPPEVPSGARPC